MAGHGTVINGDDGQGNAEIYVITSGGNGYYQVGINTAHNDSGKTLTQGEIVITDWDVPNYRITITTTGNRATGSVSADGTKFTVTDAGDTSLSGKVTISTTYGQNSGFGGQSNIKAGNVEGQAAYLSA